MRNVIKNRIALTESEKRELWQSAIFVFDTNVLLDLYRSSQKYSSELLKIMEEKAPSIWIPRQVALEFGRNRWEVIYENDDKYSENSKVNQAAAKMLDSCKNIVSDSIICGQAEMRLLHVNAQLNSPLNYLSHNSILSMSVTRISEEFVYGLCKDGR